VGDGSEQHKAASHNLSGECHIDQELVDSKPAHELEMQNGLPDVDNTALAEDETSVDVNASNNENSSSEVTYVHDSNNAECAVEGHEGVMEQVTPNVTGDAESVDSFGTSVCASSDGCSTSEQEKASANVPATEDEKSCGEKVTANEEDTDAAQSVGSEGQDVVDAPSPMDVDPPSLPVIGVISAITDQDTESEMECQHADAVHFSDTQQAISLTSDDGEPMSVELDKPAVSQQSDGRNNQISDVFVHASVSLGEEHEPRDSADVMEAEGELDESKGDTHSSDASQNIAISGAEVNKVGLCESSLCEPSEDEVSSKSALDSSSASNSLHTKDVDDSNRHSDPNDDEGVDEVDAQSASGTVEGESQSISAECADKYSEEADADLMEGDDFTVELQPEDIDSTAVQELSEPCRNADGEKLTASTENAGREETVKNASAEQEAEQSKTCIVVEDDKELGDPEEINPDKVQLIFDYRPNIC
jgi:hypothetical protein